MAWFIGFISSAFTSIGRSLVKRFGYGAVLFAAQKAVQIIVIASLLVFVSFSLGYLFQIWNMFTDLINSFQNTSVAGGDAYGISLSTIWTNAKGFIYSSGLSTALVTVGNLYISIISLIFIKAVYAIYIRVYKFLYDLVSSGFNLLATSS